MNQFQKDAMTLAKFVKALANPVSDVGKAASRIIGGTCTNKNGEIRVKIVVGGHASGGPLSRYGYARCVQSDLITVRAMAKSILANHGDVTDTVAVQANAMRPRIKRFSVPVVVDEFLAHAALGHNTPKLYTLTQELIGATGGWNLG